MQNCSLGVYVGESFAEVCGIHPSSKQVLFFERSYLPRQNLKNLLQKTISEKKLEKIDQVFVAHRYLEKLFSYRMGGSVAQLVTAGFEKLLAFDEKSNSAFKLWPQKPPNLSSPELIFSVHTKIGAQGQILEALDEGEILGYVEALKKLDIKRVCIHLYNGEKNSTPGQRISEIMEQSGFEVFIPVVPEGGDFICSWRENLLQASISGTFLELQKELAQGLQNIASEDQIFYLAHDLRWMNKEKDLRLGSLLAVNQLLHTYLQKKFARGEICDVFHFGLENFSLIHQQKQPWVTPWGLTHFLSPIRQDLRRQPTQPLILKEGNEIYFDERELTFEPGPISLGRGLQACLYDFLDPIENKSAAATMKLKNNVISLLRNLGRYVDYEDFNTEMNDLVLSEIIAEVLQSARSPRLIIYGPLSSLIKKRIQKMNVSQEIIFAEDANLSKAYMVADLGLETHV